MPNTSKLSHYVTSPVNLAYNAFYERAIAALSFLNRSG